MPPSVEDRLRDVLEAIVGIEEILAGISLDQFDNDKVLRLATERYLEIVCEAARHFPDEVKQSAPDKTHLPLLKSFVELHIGASGK